MIEDAAGAAQPAGFDVSTVGADAVVSILTRASAAAGPDQQCFVATAVLRSSRVILHQKHSFVAQWASGRLQQQQQGGKDRCALPPDRRGSTAEAMLTLRPPSSLLLFMWCLVR